VGNKIKIDDSVAKKGLSVPDEPISRESDQTTVWPATANMPTPKKFKLNFKLIAIIILGLIFVLILLSGLLLLYIRNIPNGLDTELTNQLRNKQEQAINSINNWKSYNNSSFGISFRYPNDWGERNNIIFVQDLGENFKLSVGVVGNSVLAQQNYPSFTYWQVKPQQQIEEIIQTTLTYPTIQVNGPVEYNLSGIKGVYYNLHDTERNYAEGWYIFKTDSFTHVITTIISNPSDIDIINQILSTFEFTDNSGGLLSLVSFDPQTSFAFSQPYPSELISMDSTNLQTLKCSSQYYINDLDENDVYVSNNPELKLRDQELLNVVGFLNSNLSSNVPPEPSSISSIAMCVGDNQTIIIYQIFSGGGGSRNSAHFGYLENNKVVSAVVVPADGSPYFTCSDPLVLTKDEELYYSCGGGDAGYASASIYKINLSKGSFNQIYKCTSTSDLENYPNSQVSVACE
jgi:hypothetical protein